MAPIKLLNAPVLNDIRVGGDPIRFTIQGEKESITFLARITSMAMDRKEKGCFILRGEVTEALSKDSGLQVGSTFLAVLRPQTRDGFLPTGFRPP